MTPAAATVKSAISPFHVPAGGVASTPPERRGVARDGVRLLVARPGVVEHGVFRDLPNHLAAGDLVVVNTSATLPAAVDGVRRGRARAPVHVAAELPDGTWVVEVRRPDNGGPQTDLRPAEILELSGGQRVQVEAAYPEAHSEDSRLWRVRPLPSRDRIEYLLDHGRPIRYGHLAAAWPLGDFQNAYADLPGSAEMASAGRPLTPRLLTRLVSRGVLIAPVVLHTGVSSPEKHEPPMPESFEVPEATARIVNMTRASGGRVVAVGTSTVRALESVGQSDGTVIAGRGWTNLLLSMAHPSRVCTGLVTGLHEPEASHLLLLQAVAGPELVDAAYAEAVSARYLWHEFGDSMLFLP